MNFYKSLTLLIIAIVMVLSAALSGCVRKPVTMEEKYGVSVEGVRVTAAGYMLDFRYRIRDPHKAKPLVDRNNKAFLIDEKNGLTYGVPNTAKVGPLRNTTRFAEPKLDRTYFVLFGNPGKGIQPGDKVRIEIGQFRTDPIVVQ